MTAVDEARAVADAVLYEGYVLYPYRASSDKNQARFQWGVLMPEDVVALDGSERRASRTEVVVDGSPRTLLVTVRFLHVQHRSVEDAAGRSVDRLDVSEVTYLPWDEAVETELELDLAPWVAAGGTVERGHDIPGATSVEELRYADGSPAGRLVRTSDPVRVGVRAQVTRPASPYDVAMVSIEVANRTPPAAEPGPDRPAWLRRALVACHLLLAVDGGSFVSLLEPPEWASGYVAQCRNDGLFPVLVGPDDQARLMLSSPIILYDHARLAPESRTAFFDALEVDELLSLRTMTLSEQERREVRGTDPRAAALLDDVDTMPADLWDRLHGTVRYLDSMTQTGPRRPSDEPEVPALPWWDPGSDASVDPDNDAVLVDGVEVRKGSRVLLRPGVRRADAHDLFLAGRTATVAAVLFDVDKGEHLAVTVDDDPGADLKLAHGRFLYFSPDEVEPLHRDEVGT